MTEQQRDKEQYLRNVARGLGFSKDGVSHEQVRVHHLTCAVWASAIMLPNMPLLPTPSPNPHMRGCCRRCVHEQINVLTDLVEFIKMMQRQPNTPSPPPPFAARVCGDLSSLGAHEAIPTRIFMESRCPCFAELYMHACTNHTVDFITYPAYASSLSASLLLIFSHVMGV